MPATRGIVLSLLLLASVSGVSWGQGAGPRWETNYDEALKTAAATNKLVLVHFWAPWCVPCQKLETAVFKQPTLGPQLESQYVLVKLDLDQHHALAKKWGVSAIPTDVILSPQGQLLHKTLSPATLDGYVSAMQQVAAKHQGPAAVVAAKPASVVPTIAKKPEAAATTVSQSPVPTVQQPATQQPARTSPVAASAPSPTSDGRYDYYFNRTQSQPEAPVGSPATPPVQSPPIVAQPAAANPAPAPATVDQRYAAQPVVPSAPAAAPSVSTTPVAATPPQPQPAAQVATRPNVPPTQPVANQAPRGPITQQQLPAGSPPLALDGYCPVALTEQRKWALGDLRWGAVHRGRTYLFTNQADQQKFLANPDHYSPVISGNDPVLALNRGQTVPGRREHGVFYGDRVFLFSSEETLNEFAQNPSRYSAEITSAMK